jgi:ferredoxin--NADP+ reductase
VQPTNFSDWRRIERAEEAAARPGSPREKLVRPEQWRAVLAATA